MLRALRILPVLCLLAAAQPAPDAAATARRALDAVLGGRYAEFSQMGTAELRKDLPEEALAKIGGQIKTFGALEKVSDPQITKIGPNTAAVFPVKFATQNINVRMLINSSGQVSQFIVLPGEVAWQRP